MFCAYVCSLLFFASQIRNSVALTFNTLVSVSLTFVTAMPLQSLEDLEMSFLVIIFGFNMPVV